MDAVGPSARQWRHPLLANVNQMRQPAGGGEGGQGVANPMTVSHLCHAGRLELREEL